MDQVGTLEREGQGGMKSSSLKIIFESFEAIYSFVYFKILSEIRIPGNPNTKILQSREKFVVIYVKSQVQKISPSSLHMEICLRVLFLLYRLPSATC